MTSGNKASGHTATTVGKQREINANAQLTFSFSFILRHKSTGRCPHIQQKSSPHAHTQMTIS